MSLWTLLGGYLLVALLFVLVTLLHWRKLPLPALLGDLAEAAALTMLGALWLASLGRGSWLLVFLLVGAVAGLAERGTRIAFLRSAFRQEVAGFAVTVVRYAIAGAILAWRLG